MKISLAALLGYFLGLATFVGMGIATIVGSLLFMNTDELLFALIIPSELLSPCLALGVISTLITVPGVLGGWRPIQLKVCLKIVASTMMFALIFKLVIGLEVWMQTITPKAKYNDAWMEWPLSAKMYMQENGKCCGYNNATDRFAETKSCTKTSSTMGCAPFIIYNVKKYSIDIYTAFFVFVMLDFACLMSTFVLVAVANEKERFDAGIVKSATN